MRKVTVSKLQIAQAKLCAEKCEKYSDGLVAIITMCNLMLPLSQYSKLPDEFRLSQKKSMETILRDLQSMARESKDMANTKLAKSFELEKKREQQLEE